jgi:single-strand DNA-binding protein
MGAADHNHVSIIGRLVRDGELKYTANGTAVLKFSIAVNRKKKDGDAWTDEASFFDITLWGRQAEGLDQYLQKGKQVAIAGELRQDRWQQDGQNRSKVEIIANSVQLLGGGSDSRSGTGNGNSYGSGNRNNGGGYSEGGGQRSQSQGTTRQNEDGFTDDIPF